MKLSILLSLRQVAADKYELVQYTRRCRWLKTYTPSTLVHVITQHIPYRLTTRWSTRFVRVIRGKPTSLKLQLEAGLRRQQYYACQASTGTEVAQDRLTIIGDNSVNAHDLAQGLHRHRSDRTDESTKRIVTTSYFVSNEQSRHVFCHSSLWTRMLNFLQHVTSLQLFVKVIKNSP